MIGDCRSLKNGVVNIEQRKYFFHYWLTEILLTKFILRCLSLNLIRFNVSLRIALAVENGEEMKKNHQIDFFFACDFVFNIFVGQIMWPTSQSAIKRQSSTHSSVVRVRTEK